MEPTVTQPTPEGAFGLWLGVGVLAWWFGWLSYARMRFPLEDGVVVTAALTAMSCLAGGLALGRLFAAGSASSNTDAEPASASRIPEFVLGATLVIQLVLLARNLPVYTQFDDFRDTLYNDPTVLFGGTYLFVIYMEILRALCIWAAIKIVTRQPGATAASLWLLGAQAVGDSLTTLGRFPLYYLLFFLLIAIGLRHGVRRLALASVTVATAAAVLVLAVGILLARSGIDLAGIERETLITLFQRNVVDYHVVGFAYMDELVRAQFYQIGSEFPHMTLAWFDYVAAVSLGKANLIYDYPWEAINTQITNGLSIWGWGPVNAFATNLYPLYLDGGMLLIGGVHLGLGLALGSARRRSPGLALGVLIAFALVFGIFQPYLNMGLFWLPCLVLVAERFRALIVAPSAPVPA